MSNQQSFNFDFDFSAPSDDVVADESVEPSVEAVARQAAAEGAATAPKKRGPKPAADKPAKATKAAKAAKAKVAKVASRDEGGEDDDLSELEALDLDEFDGDLLDDALLEMSVAADSTIDETAMDTLKRVGPSSDTAALYLQIIGKFKNLTNEEEREYGLKARAGDRSAAEKLVNHNLRLVVSVAKRYLNRGVDFDDLVQEGNMGLMHAVEKFRPEMGVRVTTYATFWINQKIGRAVKKSGMIRVPTHLIDRNVRRLKEARGARAEGNIEHAVKLETEAQVSTARYMQQQQPDSLDAHRAGGDDERTILDFVADDAADPEQRAMHRETLNLFLSKVRWLDERDRLIVAARCDLIGLYASELNLESAIEKYNMGGFIAANRSNGFPTSLSEISGAIGLSRERINQLFRAAMERVVLQMKAAVDGESNLSVGFDSDTMRQIVVDAQRGAEEGLVEAVEAHRKVRAAEAAAEAAAISARRDPLP